MEKLVLPKLIAIVGPTASGKSALAVQAAELFDGEIVSADSRQVYTGLDIGTGKVTPEEMRGVPHHLLSIRDPKTTYTVSDFTRDADLAISSILKRNKLPILCGGTGLYIDTLLNNLQIPRVEPNTALRKELENKSPQELFALLRLKDPARADTIDKNNPRRLLRALEIAVAIGSVPPLSYGEKKYDATTIGVLIPQPELNKKIEKRLEDRITQGMIEEARTLHENGLSWERMETLGLEYRYLARHLQGTLTQEEMVAQLLSEIIAYSKRQMTWFRKNKKIVWLTPLEILPYLQALFATR